MCHRATCPKCKKATWGGCGQHKQQVLAGIPKSQRCQCGKSAAPQAPYKPGKGEQAAPVEEKKGLFAKLFGR